MPKMVIEVPDELVEVGKVMAEHLASLQRTMARLGTGKAVDYAAIEEAMQESAAGTELAGHRAILQRLDIDVALVNKVVFALMSGLPFKTSFKNGVELVKGFLDAAIDLVPAAVFQ